MRGPRLTACSASIGELSSWHSRCMNLCISKCVYVLKEEREQREERDGDPKGGFPPTSMQCEREQREE